MYADLYESMIKDISSYDTIEYFGEPPTMKEIKSAISKMKNNKAPSGTGLSMDMLKNLTNDALDFLIKSIQEFWTNHNKDFDTWYITSLNILYKGKRDSPKTQ